MLYTVHTGVYPQGYHTVSNEETIDYLTEVSHRASYIDYTRSQRFKRINIYIAISVSTA